MIEYIVTDCPAHGTSVVADLPSAIYYRKLANSCATWRDEPHHSYDHYTMEESCWSCCDDMTIPSDEVDHRISEKYLGHTIVNYLVETSPVRRRRYLFVNAAGVIVDRGFDTIQSCRDVIDDEVRHMMTPRAFGNYSPVDITTVNVTR